MVIRKHVTPCQSTAEMGMDKMVYYYLFGACLADTGFIFLKIAVSGRSKAEFLGSNNVRIADMQEEIRIIVTKMSYFLKGVDICQ